MSLLSNHCKYNRNRHISYINSSEEPKKGDWIKVVKTGC